jgi:hypothetical protein
MDNRPLKKDSTPKALNKEPQTVVDLISEVEGAVSTGCDEAIKLSKAVKIIKKYIDDEKSFYGAAGDNVPLLGVIPSILEFELEWNFEELYSTFMLGAHKAGKVADYVCKMQKDYQKEVDEETLALSNDDILYRADKLISNHSEVLDKLRREYTKLYVDEFQDTTGLQAKLVKMLSENVGSASSANDLQ